MSDCTACQQTAPVIPLEIDNRPGLSAIAYRIGTYTTFLEALLDAIHSNPELAALRTRQSDDYSITLMELWSAVADILTFYQERIANEAYLRTATLRDSVLRLVRLIDYQLQPGLAAATLLSFNLENSATATIPIGMRVQSVPVGANPPQKFETVESINADARLNSLSIFPAPEIIQPLTDDRTIETIAPGADITAFAASLAPGDQVIAYTQGELEFLTVASVTTAGDRIQVQWTIPPSDDLSAAANGLSTDSGLFKLGRTFRLFGQDAPTQFVAMKLADSSDPTSIRGALATLDPLTIDSSSGFFLNGVFPGLKPGAPLLIYAVTATGTQWAYVTATSVAQGTATRTANGGAIPSALSGTATRLTAEMSNGSSFTVAPITSAAIYELLGPQLRLEPLAFPNWLSQPDIYLPGRRNGSISIEVNRTVVRGVIQPGITIALSDFPPGREVIIVDADPSTAMSATTIASEIVGDNLRLSQAGIDVTTVEQLGLDPSVVQPITALASPANQVPPIQDSSLINLRNPNLQIQVTIGQRPPQTVTLGPPITNNHPWTIRAVAASLQTALRAAMPDAPEFAQALAFESDDLLEAELSSLVVVPGVPGQAMTIEPTALDPDTVVDLGLDTAHVRYLDGLLSGPLNLTTPRTGTLTVQIGMASPAVVSFAISASGSATAGSLATNSQSMVRFLPDSNRLLALPPVAVFERRAFFHLALAPDGPYALDATTAVLLGNVAQATQGESVANEIVGNGNAAVPFQTFTLRKKPVTFLLGNGPHGAASTLSVAVNGVNWTEVASLYGASPTDQVYVTRIADDTTLTLEFGDGVTGARATTGQTNIVANYRTGLGVAGNVAANALTTLLDIPNGVKRATNPLSASGGADPQTLADARTNAPSTVRTFGRAVSLLDFQDVALATGAVAKASATWVWNGFQKAIFLTVAAQQGGKLSAESIHQLWQTLLGERDPNHSLLIDNYVRVPIIVNAAITVDPRYSNTSVQQAALAALLSALSFDQLQFAQPIYLSHIYAVLQDVDGVVAVNIADLNFKNQDPLFRKAHGADASKPQAHLFMLPARPGTAPGTVLPAELAWIEIASQDIIVNASGGSLN